MASFSRPLIDKQLIAMDAALAFDWKIHVHWFSNHAVIATILTLAYRSFMYQVLALVWLLILCKKIVSMQRFNLSLLIASLLTVLISTWWPALGGYVFYNMQAADIGWAPPYARVHEHDLLMLRNHVLKEFPKNMEGLITFPSFMQRPAY